MEVVRVRLIDSCEEKGCEEAPVAILDSLRTVRGTSGGNVFDSSSLRFEEIHVDLAHAAEANHLIYENGKALFERNDRALFVGGDHSITYALGRAFHAIQEDCLFLVFDASCDVSGSDANRNWLKRLIMDGVRGSRIVLIGARHFSLADRAFLGEHQVTVIGMEVLVEDLSGVCDMVMERARTSKGFYMSVDMGCCDPAFAPGVNKGEPGGFSSRELLSMVSRLRKLSQFRGGDVVEVNPKKDVNGMTVRLAAQVLAEMA